MATTITPTAYTLTQVLAPTSYGTQAGPRTSLTLDLRTAWGARVYFRIGRNAATALTRAAYFAVRRCGYTGSAQTYLDASTAYDFVGSTAAVNATTLNGASNSGTTTAVLTTNTGYAAGQACCLQSSGSRCEFVTITDLTGSTITIDDSGGFLVTHNSGDTITNGADAGWLWLPGGDQWRITPVNNSGQTVVMAVDAQVYASDTAT